MSTTYSLSKRKIEILLLEGVHACVRDAFVDAGYTNIKTFDTALDGTALLERVSSAHIIGVRSRTQLTQTVLEQAERLLAVGCFCIGTNQVDKTAAAFKGVPVFNAPYSNTRSVAELVLAQVILLLRQVPHKNQLMHQGVWQKSAANAYEARNKTLGIIGYGHIGSQLGVLAESLGMQVIYYDIEPKLPMGNARAVSFDRLLAESDVVSLHVPATDLTSNMIDEAAIRKMKPGAVFVNASRGTVVDLDALADAIASTQLLGAAVDVFPVEPANNQEPFSHRLQNARNVILTPHIGGSTLEAQANIGLEVVNKLIHYSDNGSTLSAVNFPEVSLPSHDGRSRLMHIHENKPGVMNAVNEIFSSQNVNIAGQYLQTNERVGYVVIDIETDTKEKADDILAALKAVPHTIRARVLF